MTYNVFSGTLNPTQSISSLSVQSNQYLRLKGKVWSYFLVSKCFCLRYKHKRIAVYVPFFQNSSTFVEPTGRLLSSRCSEYSSQIAVLELILYTMLANEKLESWVAELVVMRILGFLAVVKVFCYILGLHSLRQKLCSRVMTFVEQSSVQCSNTGLTQSRQLLTRTHQEMR